MKTDYGDWKLFTQECISHLSRQNCDLTAILFMLIGWSKIKTELVKRASRFMHTLFMLKIMSAHFVA